jgi:hypothetical protein
MRREYCPIGALKPMSSIGNCASGSSSVKRPRCGLGWLADVNWWWHGLRRYLPEDFIDARQGVIRFEVTDEGEHRIVWRVVDAEELTHILYSGGIQVVPSNQ